MSARTAWAEASACPLVKDKNSSISACISVASFSSASFSLWSSIARPKRNLVKGVRRSWLTPESKRVRCSIWRSILARISKKAFPAALTSIAPVGLYDTERPNPKASAAVARRVIGRN